MYRCIIAALANTVGPQFNKPPCNKVLGITNDVFQPTGSYSVMYGKEPQYNGPSI